MPVWIGLRANLSQFSEWYLKISPTMMPNLRAIWANLEWWYLKISPTMVDNLSAIWAYWVVIFENISNHGGQFKRMVEVSYLNNVHQNVWFKPPRYGYSYPEVNLKGFYGWDGGGVLLEQCFWYKKYASMMNLRMG